MTQSNFEKFVLSRVQEARALLSLAQAEIKRDGGLQLDHPCREYGIAIEESIEELDALVSGGLGLKQNLPVEAPVNPPPQG